MTSLIIDTAATASEDDVQIIMLDIIVRDEDWEGQFDRLQVFRSTQSAGGPYEELTADAWSPPRLPATAGDPPASPVTGPSIIIVGKTLSLLSNKVPIDITFTGSDPLTYAQVASQITSQGRGLFQGYVDATGALVVTTSYPGLLSRIEILNSEAAVLLGLPTTEPDSVAIGKDARPVLDQNRGSDRFEFTDYFGKRSYYYRTRFLNSTTGAQSEPSLPVNAAGGVGISSDLVIVGYVDLVDSAGRPNANQTVQLATDFTGALIGGKLGTGAPVTQLTDSNGHAAFQCVRGQKLSVSIEGTSIFRTITVPTDPAITEFNLFDPAISQDPDVFTVQVPDVIFAERRL